MQMEALEAVHRESRRLPPIQKVSVAAGTSAVYTFYIQFYGRVRLFKI